MGLNLRWGQLCLKSMKNCIVCDGGDDEGLVLMCDVCDDAYHATCHMPAKVTPLLGDWLCHVCTRNLSNRRPSRKTLYSAIRKTTKVSGQ